LRAVMAAGRSELAVGREGDPSHSALEADQLADLVAGGKVEQPHGTIRAASQHPFAVGGNGHGADPPSVGHDARGALLLLRLLLPCRRRQVVALGHDVGVATAARPADESGATTTERQRQRWRRQRFGAGALAAADAAAEFTEAQYQGD